MHVCMHKYHLYLTTKYLKYFIIQTENIVTFCYNPLIHDLVTRIPSSYSPGFWSYLSVLVAKYFKVRMPVDISVLEVGRKK